MNRLRKLLALRKSILQFFAGFALVAVFGLLLLLLWPKADIPEGWMKIYPPQDVMALVIYNDDLWSGGKDGLYVIDLQSGAVLEEVAAGRPFRGVNALLVTPADNALWVAHRDGVSKLQSGQWQHYTVSDGLPQNQILCLAKDADGDIWAGSLHGAALFKDGSWQVFDVEDGLANEVVSLIYQDSQGDLWFANGFNAQGGLTRWDGQTWQVLAPGNLLPHPSVNAILETNPGELWIGTGFASQGGLAHFDGQNWFVLTQDDGLAGGKVRSIFQDRQENLWVGSEYDGITVFYRDTSMILTPKQGLAGWEVKTMLQDDSGFLWLGTESGLTRIDQQALKILLNQ